MGQSNKTGQRNPNNPPNPRNGRSMVPYNPELRYTQADFDRVYQSARRAARTEFMSEIGATDLCAVSTPSSRWFVEAAGEDPFPELINKERGDLCMGNHTDDELANGVFLYGDMSEEDKYRAMVTGKPSSIVYLTAGKERIRWLSRHLESSLSREEHLTKQLAEHKQKIWDYVIKEHGWCDARVIRVKAEELLPPEYVDVKLSEHVAFQADQVISNKVAPTFTEEEERTLAEMEASLEEVAQSIYSTWCEHPEYKPWVLGGNSHKQEEARQLAREKLMAQKEKTDEPSV